MTTANLTVTGNGLTRGNSSRALRFILSARKPSRPLPIASLRVPVTPENRNYLRELRHAEMRAWQNSGATRRRSSTLDAAAVAKREQRDLYVFGAIVAMTLTLAAVILAQSPAATQRAVHWVSAVRNLLG
jgi:hypothetical protein